MKQTRLPLITLLGCLIATGAAFGQKDYSILTLPDGRSAPAADGVLDPGEWDGVEMEGDWAMLRQPESDVDDLGWRFGAIWDEDGLYVLMQSDYDGWVEGLNAGLEDEDCFLERQCGGSDFGGNPDSVNFYIDPNPLDLDPATANGYQFAFGLNEGFSSYVDSSITNTFIFQEAHVQTSFGNNGEYGTGEHDGHTLWSFAAVADENGAIVEMSFPWQAFDAPLDEVLHDFAPEAGDTWYANIGIITSDPGNFLPIWNWNDSQSFVTRPDGEWVFSAEELPGEFDPDLNMNGELDAGDIDFITEAIIAGENTADANEDGVTNAADRVFWINELQGSFVGDSNFDGEFGSGDLVQVFSAGRYETGEAAGYAQGDWDGNLLFDSADIVAAFAAGGYEQGPRVATAAVPEPASASLLIMAGLSLFGLRRRS